MSATPGGFAHAPVSKGILLATAGASLASRALGGAAFAAHGRPPPLLRGLGAGLAFGSPSQMLFGCLLLYQVGVRRVLIMPAC